MSFSFTARVYSSSSIYFFIASVYSLRDREICSELFTWSFRFWISSSPRDSFYYNWSTNCIKYAMFSSEFCLSISTAPMFAMPAVFSDFKIIRLPGKLFNATPFVVAYGSLLNVWKTVSWKITTALFLRCGKISSILRCSPRFQWNESMKQRSMPSDGKELKNN